MEETLVTKDKVKALLDELKGIASSYSTEEIKGGGWFFRFLQYSLATYVQTVNADYMRGKYPGLPPDAVADRRIDLARKYSSIEGGLSAGAYTGAVAFTIGTAGGASPVALPAAALSFTTDLFFTTQIQLRLAYDLAVIYQHPVDLQDPMDLYDLICVAFGIKAGEILSDAASKTAPEVIRRTIRATIKGPVLAALKRLPLIGKYLLQRNIIKFAIPVVGIPLSAGLNYVTTGQVGKRAKAIYRDKAFIQEAASSILASLQAEPSLLLRVTWLMAQADGEVQGPEADVLRVLVQGFNDKGTAAQALEEFSETIQLDKQRLFDDIRQAEESVKRSLYEAACSVAAIDREIKAGELTLLKELAQLCGIAFDEKSVRALAKRP